MTSKEVTAAKFKALRKVAEDSTLAATDVKLAILLIDYFHAGRGCAFPSRKRLAEQLTVSPSTVTRSLERLEGRGHFAVMRNKGRGHNNQYYPAFMVEKGASARPIHTAPHSMKGRVDAHKRARGRTQKGASVQQDSSYYSLKNPSKGNAPFASPLESGSRRLCHDDEIAEPLEPIEAPSSEASESSNCMQYDGEGDDDGAHQVTTLTKAIAESLQDQIRTPSDLAAMKQSDEAAALNPADREVFWLRQLDADTPAH